MAKLKQLLTEAKTIAIVGCSPRKTRTSHRIALYLQNAGYDVIPVNPYHDELLGVDCYPDVTEIPEDTRVDIVNIFRRPEHTARMVRDVIERREETGQRPTIWTQLGVSTEEAQQLAKEADLPYIHNRCIMVEHIRFT